MTPNLSVTISGAIDGNPFAHTFNWTLPALEFDIAKQALEAEGAKQATNANDGSLLWEWSASQSVPLSIPVKLPLGIKETLKEVVGLTESVAVVLSGAVDVAVPAIGYPVTRQ